MTDLLRRLLRITPGDLAGVGCIILLTFAMLVATP